MKKTTWRFKPLDSWFFRESRPMESIGGSELVSVFPPSVRTLAGAVRTAVGDHYGVDWDIYARDPKFETLRSQIGMGDDMGAMRISGPWPVKKIDGHWQRLFPLPNHLVGINETGELHRIYSLKVGQPRLCDLGCNVQLPVTPSGVKGVVDLNDYWVTGSVLGVILAGEPVTPDDLIPVDDLFEGETRLGIARDNRSRTVEKGLLYQTRHVRLKPDVAIEADIDGLEDSFLPGPDIIRFGGEGRAASFEIFEKENPLPGTVPSPVGASGLMIVLLTHTFIYQGKDTYEPLPGFFKVEQPGRTVWKGRINGEPFTMLCAITGKAIREGGWDILRRLPRPVCSLIPAGSVFIIEPDVIDVLTAVKKINLTQLGGEETDLALGRGLIAAGFWHDTNAIDKGGAK